jgi:hypothetical protein
MKPFSSPILTTLVIAASLRTPVVAVDVPVTAEQRENKIVVIAGDDLFCEVDYRSYAKPIVYPIFGPGQVPMTRDYPMKTGTRGEATDHAHHKSMWFGHGDVNGVSFWDEKGKVVTEKAEIVPADDVPQMWHGQPTVRLDNRLVTADGQLVCRETIWLSFGARQEQRWIDWQIVEHAGDTPLVFGDTKEGTAALRVHANLRPDHRATRGTDIRPAKALNSEGLEGDEIWGKRAKWVDYSGSIQGHDVGIAFFDHPQNLRHPTHWHARSYGLFAANPFGLSHFEGGEGDGSFTVPAGKSLELRYRIVLHTGDAQSANIEQQYQQFAERVGSR